MELIPSRGLLRVTQYIPISQGAALAERLSKETAIAEFHAVEALASKKRHEKEQLSQRRKSRQLVRLASVELKLRMKAGEDKIVVLSEIGARLGWGRDVLGTAISKYRRQVLRRWRQFCAHIFNKMSRLGYSTQDIADVCQIHPATVRKYKREVANDNTTY